MFFKFHDQPTIHNQENESIKLGQREQHLHARLDPSRLQKQNIKILGPESANQRGVDEQFTEEICQTSGGRSDRGDHTPHTRHVRSKLHTPTKSSRQLEDGATPKAIPQWRNSERSGQIAGGTHDPTSRQEIRRNRRESKPPPVTFASHPPPQTALRDVAGRNRTSGAEIAGERRERGIYINLYQPLKHPSVKIQFLRSLTTLHFNF